MDAAAVTWWATCYVSTVCVTVGVYVKSPTFFDVMTSILSTFPRRMSILSDP